MNIIINDIHQNGTPQLIEPGGRFDLTNENELWYIQSGAVDLFVTNQQNKKNPLAHFTRIQQGEFIIGIKDIPAPWKIIARVCSDTVVLKLKKEYFAKTSNQIQQYLSSQIDTLILRITKPYIIETFPKQFHDAQEFDETICKAGEYISVTKGVYWVSPQQGDAHFIGDRGFLLKEKSYLPVTPDSWIVLNHHSRITCHSSFDLIQNNAIWDALEIYMSYIIRLCLISIENQLLYDNIILYDKIENNQKAITQSVSVLSLSFNMNFSHMISYSKSDDPLFVAVQMITSYLNIEIKPDTYETNYLSQSNRLQNIMAYSKIFFRKVHLSGDWFKLNHGPLLAFKKTNSSPVAILPEKDNLLYENQQHIPYRVNNKIAENLLDFAYTVYPQHNAIKMNLMSFTKATMPYYFKDLIMVSIYGLIIAMLALSFPFMTQYIIDNVVTSNEISMLWQIILILLALTLSMTFLELSKRYILLNIETRYDYFLHGAFWERILKLPIKFFKEFTVGEWVSRITSLTEIRTTLSGISIMLLFDAIFSLVSVTVLFYYQSLLAIIVLIALGIFIVISSLLIKKRAKIENKIVLLNAKIFGQISQAFLAITKIRLTGSTHRFFLQWAKEYANLQQLVNKTQKITRLLRSLIDIMPLFMIFILYFSLGILFNHTASFTIGSFLAFNVTLGQITITLHNLMEELSRISEVMPLYNQSKIFIESMPEIKKDAIDPGKIQGDIELSKVTFRYEDTDNAILQDINITINAGEYVAIVGKSGSGKTTLLRLLLGFDAPSSGRIYYDNKDIANIDLDLLRRQLGVVLQKDDLVPGSIYSNIAGISELTIEQAWQIAELVGLTQDILAMPMQMNTLINMDGSGLSGGQKQRLMIARALARNPKILILDEATRSLDNISQKQVIDTLANMRITRIVVAHRLSTLVKVERIFVLENNKISEVGTYQELIDKKGIFYQLVQKQLLD